MIKRRKEDIIVLVLALALGGVILGIAFVMLWQPKPAPEQRPFGNAPTQYPTSKISKATPATSPTPDPSDLIPLRGSKTVLYNTKDGEKLADLTEDRRVLSDTDIQAKDKLLQKLFAVAPSGSVYTSANVNVEYLNSEDKFYTEITTTDIDGAKKETVDWFLSQGFTRDGLCKIPLAFFLSNSALQTLEGTKVIFSPLVPGCN